MQFIIIFFLELSIAEREFMRACGLSLSSFDFCGEFIYKN
jgi:hypothetical protein